MGSFTSKIHVKKKSDEKYANILDSQKYQDSQKQEKIFTGKGHKLGTAKPYKNKNPLFYKRYFFS